jgi:hypothetical protein
MFETDPESFSPAIYFSPYFLRWPQFFLTFHSLIDILENMVYNAHLHVLPLLQF